MILPSQSRVVTSGNYGHHRRTDENKALRLPPSEHNNLLSISQGGSPVAHLFRQTHSAIVLYCSFSQSMKFFECSCCWAMCHLYYVFRCKSEERNFRQTMASNYLISQLDSTQHKLWAPHKGRLRGSRLAHQLDYHDH